MPPKGHIRQRPSGSWVAIVPLPPGPDGRRRQKWLTAATEREAERLRRQALAEIAAGRYQATSDEPLGEYLRRWLETFIRPRRSARTARIYADLIERHIVPALGRIPLGRLTASQIEAYYLNRLKTLSPGTVRIHHAMLRTALRRAVRDELIAASPAERAEPPAPPPSIGKALSAADLKRLLLAAEGTWLHLPVMLAAFGSLRRAEVLGLRWDDVDLEGATIQVRASKTPAGVRAVVLPAFLLAALLREKGRQSEVRLVAGDLWRGGGNVVCRDDGRPYSGSALTEQFRRFREKAGFPGLRFHDLRHTHATQLLPRFPASVVSKRMGHANVSITTDLYGHLLEETDRAAAEWLDGAFGENSR